jgi:hypothetical protein
MRRRGASDMRGSVRFQDGRQLKRSEREGKEEGGRLRNAGSKSFSYLGALE